MMMNRKQEKGFQGKRIKIEGRATAKFRWGGGEENVFGGQCTRAGR